MEEKKKAQEKIIEDLDKQIKTKKTLPKKVQDDINNSVFQNIMLAVVIMLYLYFINLGYINIKPESYLIDLKTFSVGLMVTTIIIFEKAYKKDDGKLAIHGIEILILAIATLFAIHLYVGLPNKYVYIYTLISYIFAIYYIMKSIIIFKKKKKQHILSNAKEITEKSNKIENEEPNKQKDEKEEIDIEKPKKKEKIKKEKQPKIKKKENTKKDSKAELKKKEEIKNENKSDSKKKSKAKHEMKDKPKKGKRMKKEGNK